MHSILLPIRSLPRAMPSTTCLRTTTRSASAFSTSSSSRYLLARPQYQPRHTQCHRQQPLTRRHNSSAPAVDAASGPRPTAPAQQQPLTWNRFLQLRKFRRRCSLAGSIVCAGGGLVIGAMVLSTSDFDFMQFGIDPTFVIGGAVIGSMLLGWLVGPFFGNAAFNMYYRSLGKQIAQKEKEFYNRIKKFRVDPTRSSMQNPVPDYYGEKIGSVMGYRRWLKDQRAFNLKRKDVAWNE